MKLCIQVDAEAFNADFTTATVGQFELRSRFNFSRTPFEELWSPFARVVTLGLFTEVRDAELVVGVPTSSTTLPEWAIERAYDMVSYENGATLFERTFMSPNMPKRAALLAAFDLMFKHARLTLES